MNQDASSTPPSAANQKLTSSRPDYSLGKLNYVVVIEDEYLIASDMKQAFDFVGVTRVEMVSDVAGALSLLRDRSPDGAVLDLNLCGEMAFSVADVLARRQVPFVFMTGHDRSVIPERFSHITRCQKPIAPNRAVMALLRAARDQATSNEAIDMSRGGMTLGPATEF